ncbi:hypothetical protein [Nocardia cyriacigeorgica]|nr:hypothetical protein [Nocardia cyriacigeorgica]
MAELAGADDGRFAQVDLLQLGLDALCDGFAAWAAARTGETPTVKG